MQIPGQDSPCLEKYLEPLNIRFAQFSWSFPHAFTLGQNFEILAI